MGFVGSFWLCHTKIGAIENWPFATPSSTVHSNTKSNMTGRLNDREDITLTRPHQTPALKASSRSDDDKVHQFACY